MKKGFIITVLLLVIIIVLLAGGVIYVLQEKQKTESSKEALEDENKRLQQVVADKDAEISDLADQLNQLEEPVAIDEDDVKEAFERYIDQIANDSETNNKLSEYRIENITIFDREAILAEWPEYEFQYESSIPVEITYSVKPESQESFSQWIAGNGEIDEENEEWIYDKMMIAEIVITDEGYTIMSAGTGW